MDVSETRYIHSSGTDGLKLSVLRIEPKDVTEIEGIVQISHGMNEYKERYLPFLNYLADNGYITVIHDHRGHGASVRSADDLGYMYEGGYKALIEDVHEITIEIKEYAAELTGRKDLPVTLIGHSMGSMAARCYIRKYDRDIDKLCILGSPSKSGAVGIGLLMTRFLGIIFGDRARLQNAAGIIMGSYEKRFAYEGVPHSWVNSNLDEDRKNNCDPMCTFCFTLNGFENLIGLSMLTYKDGGYCMGNPSLPIRFFSGEDDPCAVNRNAFEAAMEHLRKQGYTDVEGRMYPGMRHEILNETERLKAYKDILEFIRSVP